MTVIKICGLSREADIAAVNEAKPEYCGFIIDFPKSHRNVTAEQVRKLRTGHGDTRQNTEIKDCIWKAFKIRSRKDFEDAMTSSADAVILDNGYGTGETFDWSILEDAGVMMQEKKFFLAGGQKSRRK